MVGGHFQGQGVLLFVLHIVASVVAANILVLAACHFTHIGVW